MSVTIFETLRNAEINLENVKKRVGIALFLLPLAQSQLHNAITLLEKGRHGFTGWKVTR